MHKKQNIKNFKKLSRIDLPAIFENTTDSVWAINTNYELTFANRIFKKAYHASFGIELKEDQNLLKAIPEPIQPLWKSRYDRCLLNHSFSFVDEVDTSIGKIYMEVFMNPIVIDDTVTGALFIAKDITDRKHNEIALENSKLLLQASIESQKETILFSIDNQYQYLYFNKAHANSMEYAYHQNIEVGMNILNCITN